MNSQTEPSQKLFFASDYMEGAHAKILKRLTECSMIKSTGYGTDTFSESARAKIRTACQAPEAEIHFLVGGTQANAVVIDSVLRPYQGVVAAVTGHVSTHEAGAIEACGHKVITIAQKDGKISAASLVECLQAYWQDDNHEHMVMPGMVYISQPTEYGTLYSLSELEELSRICHENHIALYMDGARLAYALACPSNDASLPDIARLCDVFYIGGTKCGALFGEAVVFPTPGFVPHFFTLVKQHGALLAKGFVAGIQFETMFTDHLYDEIGRNAIEKADQIREALNRKGYTQTIETPTNQIFVLFSDDDLPALKEKVELGFWEKADESHTVMRIATSWATTQEDVDKLISLL